MRRMLYPALLGCLLGCQDDAPAPNQTFELVQEQAVTVAGIRAVLTAVNDSRCPSGAQCIWAGYAAVTVTLTENTDTQTARIALGYKNLPGFSPDSALVTLGGRGYWLRLLAVSPVPSTTPTTQPKTATLRLRPQ